MNQPKRESSSSLILASASPRRRELLTLLGVPFTVLTADIDERPLDGESPAEMVLRLSLAKAREVASRLTSGLVIASDTIVVLDGEILGKPRNDEEARDMLRRMRGRSHTVYSGLTLLDAATGRHLSDLAATEVWMRDYGDEEIDAYVASGDPLDKAGAYAIQHAGFHPVERIEGCYTSVMGLPLCHLYRALVAWGIEPSEPPNRACCDVTGYDCRAHADILCAPPVSR